MFETYRMLGAEREAELLREAQRLHALPPPKFCARLARALLLARRLALPDRASELEMPAHFAAKARAGSSGPPSTTERRIQ